MVKKNQAKPETFSQTKFLLDFANLDKKPGNLNPPTEQAIEKWTRKSDDIKKPNFSKLKWRPCGPYLDRSFKLPNGSQGHFHLTKATHAFDKKGNRWIRQSPKNEPVWAGKIESFPSEKFHKLLKKRGLPFTKPVFLHPEDINNFKSEIQSRVESVDLNEISDLWMQIKNFLFYLPSKFPNFCDKPLTDLLNPELDEHLAPKISIIGGKVEFISEPGDIYQTIVACFANFYLNQKKVHQSLRLCPACGKFWIGGKKRGRQKVFCHSMCRVRFNKLSKKDQAERIRKYRAIQKERRQTNDIEKIFRLLVDQGNYDENEAKKEAEEWVKKGKNFKQFRDYWGL